MGRSRIVLMSALLTAATLSLPACDNKDSTDPGDTSALVGSYDLLSITMAGQPTVGAPYATGTMAMTASTYTVDLTIAFPGQPTIDIQDAGTYTVSGNQITQTSTVQDIQSVGTYELANDTLTVDVTAAGQQTVTVWLKQ